MAEYAGKPDEYERFLRQKIDELDLDRLRQLFYDPKPRDSSRYIIAIEPSPTTRMRFKKSIASRRVFELIWDKHIQHRIDVMVDFYNLFLADSIAVVEWLFQLRIHQLLAGQRTIRLFPIHGRHEGVNLVYDDYTASEAGSNPTNLRLTNSEELALVEKTKLKKGCYYRPKSADFPAIDSLRLVRPRDEPSPILLMFQIARNQRDQDANMDGLFKIDGLGLPSNARRYYVVVTVGDTQPKITVPMRYFEGGTRRRGSRRSPDEVFPVFHYPLRKEELFANQKTY